MVVTIRGGLRGTEARRKLKASDRNHVHTIKGYGMGDTAEGKNIAHGEMNMDGVRYVRDRFQRAGCRC